MRDEIKTEAEFLRSAALDIVTLEPLEDSARAEVYAIDARRIAAKLEALEARAEKAEAERDAASAALKRLGESCDYLSGRAEKAKAERDNLMAALFEVRGLILGANHSSTRYPRAFAIVSGMVSRAEDEE